MTETFNDDYGEDHSGDIGWFVILLTVFLWDYFAPETLSSAARRSIEHPIRRWPTVYLLASTTLHLAGVCPKAIDPWFYLGKLKRT